MGYCFMSIQKVKTKGAMTRKYNHNYRVDPVPNADPALSELNDELIPMNGKTYNEVFDEKIRSLDYYKIEPGVQPKRIRANAVLGMEVVLTFSREDLEHVDIEKWKKDNVEWLRKEFNADPEKYGDNVISAQFHGDEVGNVHIHAFVIPIDDKGKLNASYYIDGRQKLIELQNSYGKMMKERHGLERGLEGSRSSHQDLRHFYASLNAAIGKEIPKKKPEQSIEEYENSIQELFREQNEKYLALELKYKRKYEEFKTLSINEKVELAKAKEELARYEAIIKKFGTLDFAEDRLHVISNLNEGLKNYPDREYATKANEMINTILKYQQEQEMSEEKKDVAI